MKKYLYQLATGRTKGPLAFFLKFILWILSLVYLLGVRIVYYLYALGIFKHQRLAGKVISVGNITWGGTGKTPVVAMLAKYLMEQGKKPAVLIRGYGAKKDSREKVFGGISPKADKRVLSGQENSYKRTGDEAFMLSEILSVPVLVGKDRVTIGKKALQDFYADTLILDDGFQYWPLQRDLDIVTIDCTNAFGNGFLLPRGILREPLSALKRAQVFFLTKTDLAGQKTVEVRDKLNRINSAALIVESIHRPTRFQNLLKPETFFALHEIKSREVALVCSIGNPSAFEKTVTNLKMNPVLKFFFLDHHHYKREEISKIIAACLKYRIDTLITTNKDAVRLKDYFAVLNPKLLILVLQIDIAITKGRNEFLSRLSRLYSA